VSSTVSSATNPHNRTASSSAPIPGVEVEVQRVPGNAKVVATAAVTLRAPGLWVRSQPWRVLARPDATRRLPARPVRGGTVAACVELPEPVRKASKGRSLTGSARHRREASYEFAGSLSRAPRAVRQAGWTRGTSSSTPDAPRYTRTDAAMPSASCGNAGHPSVTCMV